MNLRMLRHLLQQEYRLSRHLFWQDENTGRIVNDVTECLKLIVIAAKELRQGEQAAWERLIRYCLDRSMSACLLVAIDHYIRPCGEFPPVPLIQLEDEQPYRNWRGGIVSLLDETDHAHWTAQVGRPEADRHLILKGEHQWSLQQPRLRAENPHHTKKNQTKATHWLVD